MSKRLWSVFTDDMDHCYFTGSPCVERHHIFGASNRDRSEKYGYVIPLRPDLHPNGSCAGKDAKKIDKKLKDMAREHYLQNHGTLDEFIQEFGKSFL